MNNYLRIILNISVSAIMFILCICTSSFAVTNETINMNLTSNTESNSIAENSNTVSTTNTSSARISTLESLPESGLGLTNILNILLITVGVLLILLAIAILIKINR